MTFLEDAVTIRSSVKENTREALDRMAESIAASIHLFSPEDDPSVEHLNVGSLFKLSYGLFVVTSKDANGVDNGCITNTVMQITDSPNRIAIGVNKKNNTHDMIKESGVFNVSILDTTAPFSVFQQFGFQSGRDVEKFADFPDKGKTANGLVYLTKYSNAVLSGKVVQEVDCDTHTIFIAEVPEGCILSDKPSMTYQYYFDHIKPKLLATATPVKGWVCKICGYIYEGEELPPDYICPICKHGVEAFEYMG